ncbi:MAG: LytTR family DNA-binding domain-containing protein [Chitinophagaceae bacterium]|nr:LytTR family DNA-binding domain-containing protein [Chitinophagaceae bacterium]
MKCLIVDDNKLARMALKEFISQIKTLTLLGESTTGMEAYEFINTKPVDLVFLDIEMPGMSGIELLQSLSNKPIIIFSTSNSNYAVDAFDLNVADFVVKPVTFPRLLQSVEKAQSIYDHRNTSVSRIEPDFIFLKDKGALVKISFSDILWMEAMGDYVKIYTSEKWFMAHTTMKSVEIKLPQANFMRVHRSYIVAISKIERIKEGAIIIGTSSVPLAETYRSQLMDRLNLI